MQSKIFNLVANSQEEVFLDDVASKVFRIKTGSDSLIDNVVKPLLVSDNRFYVTLGGKVILSTSGKLFKSFMNMTFVAVDIETTGMITPYDKITELAAMRIEGGVIVDSYETLINPGRYIPDNVVNITGISNDMVLKAPTIDEVIPEFLSFLGDDVFIAHNNSFDLRFINSALKEYGTRALCNPALCTCKLGRKLFPEIRKYDLGTLAKHFGIVNNARHRAGGDAAACAHIFLRLATRFPENNIFTLEDLLNYS